MEQIFDYISNYIMVRLTPEGIITQWNRAAEECFEIESNAVIGNSIAGIPVSWDEKQVVRNLKKAYLRNEPKRLEDFRFKSKEGRDRFLSITFIPVHKENGAISALALLGYDVTERRIRQGQIELAQRLESIGQLAAGIAHEINTPIQYVGDNLRFLREAFQSIGSLLGKYHELGRAVTSERQALNRAAEAEELSREMDLPYLEEEIPKAVDQALEGVDRVADIVRAMKEFSHPGSEEKALVDINRAIESTVIVARNGWKYVADLKTEFDDSLPFVPCIPGEFNQVILNMIINASHAIADKLGPGSTEKGTIFVQTKQEGDWAMIRISDTGTGIPEKNRKRIFEPFFTTKEVGRGTGQGLAISYTVVVEKHGGTIDVESELGKGTTFTIRLPLRYAPEEGIDEWP